jgi:hypothetical protein
MDHLLDDHERRLAEYVIDEGDRERDQLLARARWTLGRLRQAERDVVEALALLEAAE